jgi:hypothetical protein
MQCDVTAFRNDSGWFCRTADGSGPGRVEGGKLKCAWSSIPGNPSAGKLFARSRSRGIYAYQLRATELTGLAGGRDDGRARPDSAAYALVQANFIQPIRQPQPRREVFLLR